MEALKPLTKCRDVILTDLSTTMVLASSAIAVLLVTALTRSVTASHVVIANGAPQTATGKIQFQRHSQQYSLCSYKQLAVAKRQPWLISSRFRKFRLRSARTPVAVHHQSAARGCQTPPTLPTLRPAVSGPIPTPSLARSVLVAC